MGLTHSDSLPLDSSFALNRLTKMTGCQSWTFVGHGIHKGDYQMPVGPAGACQPVLALCWDQLPALAPCSSCHLVALISLRTSFVVVAQCWRCAHKPSEELRLCKILRLGTRVFSCVSWSAATANVQDPQAERESHLGPPVERLE